MSDFFPLLLRSDYLAGENPISNWVVFFCHDENGNFPLLA